MPEYKEISESLPYRFPVDSKSHQVLFDYRSGALPTGILFQQDGGAEETWVAIYDRVVMPLYSKETLSKEEAEHQVMKEYHKRIGALGYFDRGPANGTPDFFHIIGETRQAVELVSLSFPERAEHLAAASRLRKEICNLDPVRYSRLKNTVVTIAPKDGGASGVGKMFNKKVVSSIVSTLTRMRVSKTYVLTEEEQVKYDVTKTSVGDLSIYVRPTSIRPQSDFGSKYGFDLHIAIPYYISQSSLINKLSQEVSRKIDKANHRLVDGKLEV